MENKLTEDEKKYIGVASPNWFILPSIRRILYDMKV